MDTVFSYIVLALSYLSITCIILPWCGVPEESSGSWFLDHFFALMSAGSIAAFAIGIGLFLTKQFGIDSAWAVMAGIVLTGGGCCVAYLRWVR